MPSFGPLDFLSVSLLFRRQHHQGPFRKCPPSTQYSRMVWYRCRGPLCICSNPKWWGTNHCSCSWDPSLCHPSWFFYWSNQCLDRWEVGSCYFLVHYGFSVLAIHRLSDCYCESIRSRFATNGHSDWLNGLDQVCIYHAVADPAFKK